jgi:hypothetical protein
MLRIHYAYFTVQWSFYFLWAVVGAAVSLECFVHAVGTRQSKWSMAAFKKTTASSTNKHSLISSWCSFSLLFLEEIWHKKHIIMRVQLSSLFNLFFKNCIKFCLVDIHGAIWSGTVKANYKKRNVAHKVLLQK